MELIHRTVWATDNTAYTIDSPPYTATQTSVVNRYAQESFGKQYVSNHPTNHQPVGSTLCEALPCPQRYHGVCVCVCVCVGVWVCVGGCV
jgi:hypothetical protein